MLYLHLDKLLIKVYNGNKNKFKTLKSGKKAFSTDFEAKKVTGF